MSANNRYYTRPPSPGHGAPAFTYIYDVNAVWTGDNNYVNTGGWRTFIPTDLDGYSYQANFSGITSGQVAIPVGARSWSIVPESGNVYINGTLSTKQTPFYSYNGVLSASINVGTTGGRVLVEWQI